MNGRPWKTILEHSCSAPLDQSGPVNPKSKWRMCGFWGAGQVEAARKSAVRLYWMLRTNVGYPEIARIESSPRVALVDRSQTDELIERSRIQHGAGGSHGSIMVDV
jgi:hypothetical protein